MKKLKAIFPRFEKRVLFDNVARNSYSTSP